MYSWENGHLIFRPDVQARIRTPAYSPGGKRVFSAQVANSLDFARGRGYSEIMELLEQLERRVSEMLERITELEEENQLLKEELLEAERRQENVVSRIDGLLKKVQGEIA